MTDLRGLDFSFRYRCFDSGALVACGQEPDAASVLHGLPVRRPPTYRGQINYPGLFWSATTSGLLIYESLLELDRLWFADFDIGTVWIATQPFEITGLVGGKPRRHIPDLMLTMSDGQIHIVDVKPASRVDLPDVAAVFDWTSHVYDDPGWDYEVWSGEPVTRMANIRFLGSTRRSDLVDSAMATLLLDVFRDGQTVADLLDAVSGVESDRSLSRTALIHLIWRQAFACDLARPLSTSTVLRQGKGSWDECNS